MAENVPDGTLYNRKQILKLAAALSERADLQKKLSELGIRLNNNADSSGVRFPALSGTSCTKNMRIVTFYDYYRCINCRMRAGLGNKDRRNQMAVFDKMDDWYEKAYNNYLSLTDKKEKDVRGGFLP